MAKKQLKLGVLLLVSGLLILSLVLASCSGNYQTSSTLSPSTSSSTTTSSSVNPLAVIKVEQRELGTGLFYGPYSVWGDTLVALERDYADPSRQYIVTIDLKTGIITRLPIDLSDKFVRSPPSVFENRIVWPAVDKDGFLKYIASSSSLPEPNYDIYEYSGC